MVALFDEVDSQSLMIATTFLGLVVMILLMYWTSDGLPGSSTAERDAVVLIGDCGAGKTALLYRLLEGIVVKTVSSMRPQEIRVLDTDASEEDTQRSRVLVDFPGHARLRQCVQGARQLMINCSAEDSMVILLGDLSSYWTRAAGAILVVDSTLSDADLRETAAILADVFTNRDYVEAPNGIPLLVACNKTDLKESRPVDEIAQALEAELDRLKSSRAAVRQQGEDNEDDEDEIFLGAEGTPFSFESDSPCDVLFVPCSVVDGSGMEDLQEFIGRAFDEEE